MKTGTTIISKEIFVLNYSTRLKFRCKSSLNFNSVSELDTKKEILNLSSKIATRKGDNIPAKMLKNSINAYLSELIILINNCLKKGVFPDDLKLADIRTIYKKEDSL